MYIAEVCYWNPSAFLNTKQKNLSGSICSWLPMACYLILLSTQKANKYPVIKNKYPVNYLDQKTIKLNDQTKWVNEYYSILDFNSIT